MTQVETYRNLTDKRIEKITKFLDDLDYPESVKEDILLHAAQWLYNNYVSIESTCLIISNIINIEPIQEQIDNIYDELTPPLPAKSYLQNTLKNEEYFNLEKLLEPREKMGTVSGEIDDNTNIITNFKTKQVLQEKVIYYRDGKTDNKFTPIIEAVPYKLIVYDSPLLDQPRTFKIIWDSEFTQRKFVTAGESSGATIKEITNYLVDAGFTHNPRQVDGAVSCMINSLIKDGFAEIKTDIDTPGVYYDVNNDKITVVKLEFNEVTNKEALKTHKTLIGLSEYFKDNLSVLATVLKWGLMSMFSYAMKQSGKWMPWMYLKGSAGSGKTTIAKLTLYTWGVPTPENNFGGSSFDTVARLGAKVSQSCGPIVVNEPAAVFNRNSTKEMVKVCVESTTARSKYKGSYFGGVPAFSPALFTANQYLPEDDALLRRLYVLSFSYSQRKTEAQKRDFEKAFHMDTPSISPLVNLQVLGRFAIREIISNPSVLLDDWQQTADELICSFYASMGIDAPDWLLEWAESENLDDFDTNQREDIRNFFVAQFNQARKKVQVTTENGFVTDNTLDTDEASTYEDFEDINWSIINNRMLNWALPRVSRADNKHVCLTQGLRTALGEHINFCNDLKSIAELIGWTYKSVKINGKSQWVVDVKFDEFMEFLYPSIEFDE
ncbi:hypothetical protein [uncultured Methanobrevibacter sp.]|uniref:hypothetical protein n=1 Tax=uncultured Methanobrevibacter sp. TaxID=253161 RepID=UPI0025D1AD48|nr:hypothetical protein [uncultured Methanobrevibacter sp.]